MTIDHYFEPYTNGRSPNSCQRCGRVPSVHPQPSPEVRRDTLGEEQIMLGAASTLVAYPEEYVRRAMARAHPTPVQDFVARDLDQDGIEEALDGGNYSTWGIQQLDHQAIDPETASQKRTLRAQALSHFAAAYECLRQAQELK